MIATMILVGLIITACTGPVETRSVDKVTIKDTRILFSESRVTRGNSREYVYMVEGIEGQYITLGHVNCLKTFNIELGRTYTVKLNYNSRGVILVKSLCEFTARLKTSSNM